MPRSSRLRLLESRCSELRKHLLPPIFSPTGVYSRRTLDKACGYLIMVHAELESYFEDRVCEIAKIAVLNWKSKRKVSRTLLGILQYFEGDVSFPVAIALGAQDRCDTDIEAALTQVFRRVSQNHGIKEKNLLQLLCSIGVLESEIDLTWLKQIDGLGRFRGSVAHTSGHQRLATYSIDPKTAFDDVKQILSGTKSLDETIQSVLN